MSSRSKNRGKTGNRDERGRFRCGHEAPGPGRPAGSRNRATLVMDELLDGEADKLMRKAIELAMAGDAAALRLCLERLCPPRKDRPVQFQLPEMETAADAAKVTGALLLAVARGELTPMEAQAIGHVVERFRRTLETEDLARRVAALEGAGVDT